MDYTPEIFQEAPIGEIAQSGCSPQMPVTFTGVAVQAPERIVLGGDPVAVVPLCGYFQLPAAQTVGAEPMVIHVRRQSDGEVASAQLGMAADEVDEPEEPVPADAPQPSAAALANTLTEGWFHVDAQKWVTMYLTSGRFDFVISFAGAQSEAVTVEIAP